MMTREWISLWVVLIGCGSVQGEVFEVTSERVGDLPGGKEADGLPGDFVLRNELVEVVIAGNAPLRRANMSTFYGADGITPGCLYDLTLRGTNNDQITVFSPLRQQGEVSWAQALPDVPEGAVETVVTPEKAGGVGRRHRYRLEEGVAGVFIDTELFNGGATPQTVKLEDRWTRGRSRGFPSGDLVGGCGRPRRPGRLRVRLADRSSARRTDSPAR